MNAECPLLAQSGHPELHRTCPLLGVKRTSLPHRKMSAYDPKRTSAGAGRRSLNEFMECRRCSGSGLPRLDVERLDHFAPLLGFVGDEVAEIGR